MKLPKIPYQPEKLRQETVAMGGLNWADRFRDGELRDSRNLSFRRWPYLTTRKARVRQEGYAAVTALAAREKLAAVRGRDLLYDGKKVGTVTAGEKQFAVVNTKLVIWPDRVYLDLETQTVKPMGAKMTLSARSVTFTGDSLSADARPKIDMGGKSERFTCYYEDVQRYGYPRMKRCAAMDRTAAGWALTGEEEVQCTALREGDLVRLANLGNGAVELNSAWNDYSYGAFHDSYYAVVTRVEKDMGYESVIQIFYDVYYCPVRNGSFLDAFKAGDAVTISGAGENDKESAVIREVTDTALTFTTASLFEEGAADTAVTVERKVPALEFICESENRLWGCEGHTVWASALGDPTNFYVYEGLSTDSYAVAVGSDGAFTGCVGYSEGVLFWKADRLHKVLGTAPGNYELHTYSVPGVQAGSERSQAVINDVLFYKGERGVYAYAGGTPQLLSECFGERRFTDAVGGSDGERYYLSVKEGDERRLLVYDPEKGLWLQEDDTGVRDFARLGNRLYFADEAGSVWLIDGGGEDPDQEWRAQFTPFYETAAGRKSYSRLLLRLELPRGSWVMVETRRDGGPWQECGKVIGRKNDVVPLRIPVNRCDKLELRLKGKGPCGVLSVLREFTVRSER